MIQYTLPGAKAMSKEINNVAVVGLGFGAEFIPLWQKHPHAKWPW